VPKEEVPEDLTAISSKHVPVLLDAVLNGLNLQVAKTYVDGTLGMGGHSQFLLEALHDLGETSPRWVGVDQDARALGMAQERLAPTIAQFKETQHIHFVQSNYSEIPEKLPELGITGIDGGLLLDLGVSSYQLDTADRGFSFMRSGPLDMRMNGTDDDIPTAADILNTASFEELCRIFELYGEEKYAYPIAKAIVEDRAESPWHDTLDLAKLVERIYRLKQKSGKAKEAKHPATRVFQALRMAVNGELEHLESTLNALSALMQAGSRVAIITFHSLEDRLVKQTFKPWLDGCVCPPQFPICTCGKTPLFKAVNRKPLEASELEKDDNPRSRSAKLRVYSRL
jgi:16S rRNA (cytosine1402-N4)-methyltransferase